MGCSSSKSSSKSVTNVSTKSNESLISAHQRERIARIFKMKSSLHAGDDGKVVLGDFIAWGAAVAKGNSIEFNDARKSEWTMAFNTFFANGAAGESVDAFVENCQTFLKYAGAGTIAEAAKVNIVLFKCIDANQDSRVSFAEYFSFVQPLGVSEDDAKVGFAAIDTDGNGELSQQEVAVACAKYYFSPDDNDHKHFYGKFNL